MNSAKLQPFSVKLQPFSGEALTSYIQRICWENMINPLSLLRELQVDLNRYTNSNESSKLDHYPNKMLSFLILSEITGIPVDELEDLNFINVVKRFSSKDALYSSNRFLTSELENYRKFCPHCVREEGYYKLLWQIKEVEACLNHKVYLMKECPECYKPITCLFPWSSIGYCNCGYDITQTTTKPCTDFDLNIQHRIQADWSSLLGNKNIKIFNQKRDPQSLALALLYVANDFEEIFKGMKKLETCLSKNIINSLLQSARKTHLHNNIIHVRTILDLIRDKNITVNTFFNLDVPETFTNSVLTKPVKYLSKFYCITPWCSSYKKSRGLKKTGSTGSKKELKNKTLRYYFFCQECGVKYAINEDGKIVERGFFIDLAWKQVRPLLNKGISRDNIVKKLGIRYDKLSKCIAYLAANKLLNDDVVANYLGCEVSKEKEAEFLKLVNDGHGNNKIRQMLSLPNPEFLYYQYKIGVIKHSKNTPELDKQKKDRDIINDKIKDVLETMVRNREDITIKKVAEKLNVSLKTIYYNNGAPLIDKMKKIQKEKYSKIKAKELKKKIDNILKKLRINDADISSARIYESLGINRTVLVRDFPQLTKYISEKLRKHRELEHKKKVENYISIARELIEDAKYTNMMLTTEDLANEIGVSVSTIKRYPEILSLLKEELNLG